MRKFQIGLSVFLTLALVFALLPGAVFAGEAAEDRAGETKTVFAADPLPANVSVQALAPGEEPVLPETLTGNVYGTPEAEFPVVWESSPAFDANVAGEYLFAATPAEGYALAEGVLLPGITVVVKAKEKAEETPPEPKKTTIDQIDELDEDAKKIDVEIGTAKEKIEFPVLSSNGTQITGVLWDCETYDAKTPGEYVFRPVISAELYEPTKDLEVPGVRVVVLTPAATPAGAQTMAGEGVLEVVMTGDSTLKGPIETALALAGVEASTITTLVVTGTGELRSYFGIPSLLPNVKTVDLSGFNGSFARSAFVQMSQITAVKLPAGVAVSETMFDCCYNLTTLTVGNGEFEEGVIDLSGYTGSSFGDGVFRSCSGIIKVRLPENTPVSDEMFAGCRQLNTLIVGNDTLDEGVLDLLGYTQSSFGISAFSDCGGVLQVKLPNGVPISDSMFDWCTALETLTIGENAAEEKVVDLSNYTQASFGESAFHSCSGITSVKLPTGTPLSNGMFGMCGKLQTLTVGTGQLTEGVLDLSGYVQTAFGEEAFYSCSAITTVKLPLVAPISDWMFYNCDSLKTLSVGSGEPTQDIIDLSGYTQTGFGACAFSYSDNIDYVRLPTGAPVSDYMFRSCPELKTLTVGKGSFIVGVVDLSGYIQSSFGTGAFYFTNMAAVRLPSDVSLSDYMFGGCNKLRAIICTGDAAPLIEAFTFVGVVVQQGVICYPATSTDPAFTEKTFAGFRYWTFKATELTASITTDPQNCSVSTYESATFTAITQGAPATYRWQVSSDGGANWADIENARPVGADGYWGADTESLSIRNVSSVYNGNRYRLTMHNLLSGAEAVSGAATLTVSSAKPTVYLVSPSALEYLLGSTAGAIEVTAYRTDGGTLSYQWYKNTENNTTGGEAIGGATQASYTPSANEVGTTYYYCVVTNTNSVDGLEPSANSSPTKKIEVYDYAKTPNATASPGLGEIYYELNASARALRINASSPEGGSISYQWYAGGHSYDSPIQGATTATYFPPTDKANKIHYTCVVTNTVVTPTGEKTATKTVNSARVTVFAVAKAPVVATHPQNAEYRLGAAAGALEVNAQSPDGGKLSYQWYKNTVNSATGGSSILGATKNKYVPPSNSENITYYYCIVMNTLNSMDFKTSKTAVSNIAKITIISDATSPAITAHPQSASYTRNVASSALSVQAYSPDGGTLSYQWYKNTANRNTGGSPVQGAKSASYKPPTDTVGTTYYYCVVTNTNNTVGGAKTASIASNAAGITVTAALPSDPIDAFVTRLYNLVFGVDAPADGVREWGNALRSGASGTQVAYGFFFSPQYTGQNTSSEQYVKTLYETLLNRTPDSGGLAAWKDPLDNGMSREHIFGGLANSAEFAGLCSSAGIVQGSYASSQPRDKNYNITAFVSRLYKLCLGREVDAGGLDSWAESLLSGAEGAKVAYGFFFSDEMANRNLGNKEFVQVLYRVLMNREGDAGGINSWLQAMNEGATALDVFGGFVYSPEFTQLCADYGIVRGTF